MQVYKGSPNLMFACPGRDGLPSKKWTDTMPMFTHKATEAITKFDFLFVKTLISCQCCDGNETVRTENSNNTILR